MKTIKEKERLRRYMAEPSYAELIPREMDNYAILQRSAPGEVIISQGDEPETFMFLAKGSCGVSCVLPNGKSIILKTIYAPALLGEMELIEPERSALTVRALEECEIITFPMDLSRSILLNDNHFLRKLCALLGSKERLSVLQFFTSAGYPLEKRLAAFILEHREGEIYRIRKTQAAQTLGVSYRHLETVLSRFVKGGILSKNRLIYRIEDETALMELAREMTLINE